MQAKVCERRNALVGRAKVTAERNEKLYDQTARNLATHLYALIGKAEREATMQQVWRVSNEHYQRKGVWLALSATTRLALVNGGFLTSDEGCLGGGVQPHRSKQVQTKAAAEKVGRI